MPIADGQREQVLWFEDVGSGDVGRVGGKNASLGEMVRSLGAHGVRVPPGFATTADPRTGRAASSTSCRRGRRPCSRSAKAR